jgi:hypothetical protein
VTNACSIYIYMSYIPSVNHFLGGAQFSLRICQVLCWWGNLHNKILSQCTVYDVLMLSIPHQGGPVLYHASPILSPYFFIFQVKNYVMGRTRFDGQYTSSEPVWLIVCPRSGPNFVLGCSLSREKTLREGQFWRARILRAAMGTIE